MLLLIGNMFKFIFIEIFVTNKIEYCYHWSCYLTGKPTAVKLVDRETLIQERESKKKAEVEKLAEKEKKKKELEAAQALKEAQRRVPPQEMFRSESDKYSAFDEKVKLTVKVPS